MISNIQLGLTSVACWLFILGAASIPLLGAAAHNIFFGLALLIGLAICSLKDWRELVTGYRTLAFGLLLFAWLGVSLSWTQVSFSEGVGGFKKYLELLMMPVFVVLLSRKPDLRDRAMLVFYVALLCSLAASYLIHFELVGWTDNPHSLKNRIFHGISMSLFGYLTLKYVLAAELQVRQWLRIIGVLIYIITLISVFFIENGRTGYLSFIGMSALAVAERLGLKRAIVFMLATSAVLALMFTLIAPDQLRLFNVALPVSAEGLPLIQQLQLKDIRLEYYVIASLTYLQNWWLGFGAGSFESAYLATLQSMESYWGPTANAHNEMLMLGIQSGILGILLYLGFIITLAKQKVADADAYTWQRSGLGVAALVFVAGLFNSSIMDHGDGILFMAAISLLLSGAKMPTWLFVERRSHQAI